MEVTWKDLVVLLRSNKNASVTCDAIVEVLESDVSSLPDVFHVLAFELLISGEFNTRTNAAELLEKLGRNFGGLLSVLIGDSGTDGDLLDLNDIDIPTILSTPGVTLQSKLPTPPSSSFVARSIYSVEWLDSQRRELRARIGIDVEEGVLAETDSDPYITEEDMANSTASAEELSTIPYQLNLSKLTATEESWLARIVRCMVVGLLSPQWEVRHGYSLGLGRLLRGIYPELTRKAMSGIDAPVELHRDGAKSSLPDFIRNDIACCGVCVLLLDRFIDFGEGSSGGSVAPVKEVAGQLLTCVMRCEHADASRTQLMWKLACEMSTSREHWTVTLGGFIALKNILPFCWWFISTERWQECVATVSEGVRHGVEPEVAMAACASMVAVCASAVSHSSSASSVTTHMSHLKGYMAWTRLIGEAICMEDADRESPPSLVCAWSDALCGIAAATADGFLRCSDRDADTLLLAVQDIISVCGGVVGCLFVYDSSVRRHCLNNISSVMRSMHEVCGKGLIASAALLHARAEATLEHMFCVLGGLVAAGCLSTQRPIVDLRLDDAPSRATSERTAKRPAAERGLKRLVEEAAGVDDSASAAVSAEDPLASAEGQGAAEHDRELRLREGLVEAWVALAYVLYQKNGVTSDFVKVVVASVQNILLVTGDCLLAPAAEVARPGDNSSGLACAGGQSFRSAVERFCRVEIARRPLEQDSSVHLPGLIAGSQFAYLAPMVCRIGVSVCRLQSLPFADYRILIDECLESVAASAQVSIQKHNSTQNLPDQGTKLPKKRPFRFVVVADTVVQTKKRALSSIPSAQLDHSTTAEIRIPSKWLGIWWAVVSVSLLFVELGVAEADSVSVRSQLRSRLLEAFHLLESTSCGWCLPLLRLILANEPHGTCAAFHESEGPPQAQAHKALLRQFLAVATARKLSTGTQSMKEFAPLVGLFARGTVAAEFAGQVMYAFAKEHQENMANILDEYFASVPPESFRDPQASASTGVILLHALRACTASARRALNARFDVAGRALASAGTVADPCGRQVGIAAEVLLLLMEQPASAAGHNLPTVLMSQVVGRLHQLLFAEKPNESHFPVSFRSQLAALLEKLTENSPEQVLGAYEVLFATALRGLGDRDVDVRRKCVGVFRSLVPLAPLAKQTAARRAELSTVATTEARDEVQGAIERSSELLQHIFTKQNPFRIQRSQHPRDLDILAELTKYSNLVRLGLPSLSPAQLRDYQWDGVSWLTQLRRFGLNGILADEMGLGKSLQALAAVAVLRIERRFQTAPTLVVCPASVVMHWEDEVKKYFAADLLSPVRFSTSLSSPAAMKLNAAVVIVSYETARRDITSGQRSLLRGVLWECVVLDEAHLIKNPAASVTKAVCSLQSKHRMALSGTPVQNQVEELWSLMHFLLPDYIGDHKQFRKEVVNPIVRSFAARKELRTLQEQERKQAPIGGSEAAKARKKNDDPLVKFRQAVEISAVGLNLLRTLHKQVLPFILRRSKEMVARDLPSKTVVDVLCPLSSDQQQLYRAYQERLRTSDDLLETEYAAAKGIAAAQLEVPSTLDFSTEELAARSSQPLAKEEKNLVSEGWGNMCAAGGLSLPAFEDEPEVAARQPKLNTIEALTYLKLLCLHPALVVDASHSRFRARLLDSPASSGKMVRLAVLLMDSGVIARDEFSADHSLDELLQLQLQLGGDLVERAGAAATLHNDSDESSDESAGQAGTEAEVCASNADTNTSRAPGAKEKAAARQTPVSSKGNQNLRAAIQVGASLEEELAVPLHRCLIFAQHRAALDLVEEHVLRRYFPSVGYERMDGSLEPLKRAVIARRFNDQPRRGALETHAFQREGDNTHHVASLMSALPSAARAGSSRGEGEERPGKDVRVLLMTTRSCGLGLNLTAADTVIFLEHDWNPFADLQAMDRVHRIGQTQPVTVYRLLAESTVEARIMKLQSLKQNIATQIINEENSGAAGSQQFGSMLLGSLLLRPDSN